MGIAASISAYPNIAIGCNLDSMVGRRPFEFTTSRRTTPGAEQISFGIKFQYGRSCRAALRVS
jgi:hypothetical protein